MADVVFQNVSKVYTRGERPAVDNFSLTVKDGEFLVLVGPSGCGKSTTLRMVAGLEIPTAGRIEIGGRNVTHLAPKDRDIAMVFQNYALYPHMTVQENLSFALKLRHVPRAEIAARVKRVAHSLGLTPYLKRLPKALSGGQRQRVALGRAIVREPAVFLFDEPLSNLDAKMRVEMRAEIIRLHQTLKATMIYVTHDQTEAMTMGERIVVMNEGEIQQVAPPLELYEKPANPFVASFVGTPPMNLFPPGVWTLNTTFGVRPEHLSLSHNPPRDQDREAVVDFLEPLGPETLVHMLLTGSQHRAVVRVPGFASYHAGEKLTLSFDPQKVIEYGRRVSV